MNRDSLSSRPFGRRVAQLAALAIALVGMAVLAAEAPAVAAAPPVAHGSVNQVWATGIPANSSISLINSAGKIVQTTKSDAQGGVLFRNVPAGSGYRLRLASRATSAPVTVHKLTAAPWDPSVYNQKINPDGYGYLTTRDGTKLAYAVHLPTDPATLGVGLPSQLENQLPNLGLPLLGPYPTLI
ncbi:MAG TPA: carboxypeptidase-like regulatory domain-containing protein, partial [Marmoricola sp.]|nr:carboxypeptidase-like regulatory domain-containing protein [Marmoricola sp.]